jgi:hypothetical protein
MGAKGDSPSLLSLTFYKHTTCSLRASTVSQSHAISTGEGAVRGADKLYIAPYAPEDQVLPREQKENGRGVV